jgi:FixJ family two-component response regulator
MTDVLSLVFIVDDDASVRDALSNLLRSVGLNVVAFASAHEFLSGRIRDVLCCLVLDVRLPGQSGLDLQHELRRSGEEIPIIFISAHGDIPMTVQAMKAGAVEFLPKPFREQDLLDAVRSCLDRAQSTWSRRAELESISRRFQDLTTREREVLTGLLMGRLNKQVAGELGISEMTVKIHRRHIMEKMAASSMVELGRMVDKLRTEHAAYI